MRLQPGHKMIPFPKLTVLPLKIDHPQKEFSSSNHHFSEVMLVSGYDLGMAPPFPVVSHHQDYSPPSLEEILNPQTFFFTLFLGKGGDSPR